MMLCLDAPEVFKLPRAVRHIHPSFKSEPCLSDGSPKIECDLNEPVLESLIKVCVTLCEQYVFVLTSQVLHIYSNLHRNVHLGRFTLDDELYLRYGAFRDIVFIPGWRNFCLLMEKQKRVLICTYDIAHQGLEALADLEIQKQLTASNHGTPIFDRSPSSSVRSVNMSPSRGPSRRVATPVVRSRLGRREAATIKYVRRQYEGLLEPVEIKMLYVLALPDSIHTITVSNSQMYFWTVEPPGVYITLCPEGFTNYLACSVNDDLPVRMNLNLHATNLLSHMMARGSVSMSKGLCYLCFKDTISAIPCKKSSEINLYVKEASSRSRISSLSDWVDGACSAEDSEKEGKCGTDASFDSVQVSSRSNGKTPSSAVKATLEEMILDMRIYEVLMVPEEKCCFIITRSGALVSLHIGKVKKMCLGKIIYKQGVKSIVSDGRVLVVDVDQHVTVFAWHDGRLRLLWKYRLLNMRSLTIRKGTIAALYNHDGFICFNAMGKILVHRRSRIDDSTYQSSCFASKGLSIIATRVSKLIMYKMHSVGYVEAHYSNPWNDLIAFVGADSVLLFHTKMMEGTFGVPSKPISEDRHVHAYDNSELISDVDCGLFTVSTSGVESVHGRWPLTHVSPSPSGRYLLGVSDKGRAIYSVEWEWFEAETLEYMSMGWLNDDICFFLVNVPMRLLLGTGQSRSYEVTDKEVLSLGDLGTSYCYFFQAPDLRESIAFMPLKSRPQCCHVFDETLYILDETQTITGYLVKENQGNYKLQVIFHTVPETTIGGRIRQLYCLDNEVFMLLSETKGLYRMEGGRCTKVLEDCSHVIATVDVVEKRPIITLLCSVRFYDQLVVITRKQQLTTPAYLPAVALVDQGVVSYLINLVDPDNSVQKIRIGKMPLPFNDIKQTIKGPFYVDILDRNVSNITEDKKAKSKELSTRIKRLPKEMLWRLIARQARKRNMKEEVEELESIFKCDLAKVFEGMVSCGRGAEASFMLIALQSITDPIHVRSNHCLRLLDVLSMQISTSMTDDSVMQLFQSLLRFQYIVAEAARIDVEEKVVTLMQKCDIMAVYKFCKFLNLDLAELIRSARSDLEKMYVWGVCQLQPGCCEETQDSGESQRIKVDVSSFVVSLRMRLGLCDDLGKKDVHNSQTAARTEACKYLGMLDSAPMLPYSWPMLCSHYFDILVTEGLLLPAAAIALATENFVAISRLVVMDNGIKDIVQYLRIRESECDKCASKFKLLKRCLLDAQKSFVP